MNLIERASKPTPKFFKKLRKAALILTGVSGAILTAPVSFPALLVTIAGYLATAGAVAAAVSQVSVDIEPEL